MNTQHHRRFSPVFQGRTRDAIVTSMVGNVVGVRFRKKAKRPPLQSTAVLGTTGRAH